MECQQDFSTIDEIAKECDAIFRLESLAATPLEKQDMWKEYSGNVDMCPCIKKI